MLEKALLIFIFLLPFQFALHPAPGVDLAWARLFALGIVVFWGAKSLLERRLLLPRPLTLFFLSAFLLWETFSFLWAENASWAFRKALFLLSFLPLFFVFFSLLRQPGFRKKIFQAFASSAALIGLFSLGQFFSQFIFGVERVFAFWVKTILPFFLGPTFGEAVASYPSLLVNISGVTVMRASGLFPDPHMCAFFLGMALPFAIAFALENVSRKRTFWIVCAGIIFIADLLTFSRGGYLGLFFGLSAFFLSFIGQTVHRKKHLLHIGAAGLIAAIVIFTSPVGTRLLSSFSQSDGSNVERLRLWQEGAASVAARPWLGTGLGNYPLLVKPSAEYREPIYAHNLFLDIALETGLVGLFFFAGWLFLGIWSAWKRWQREGDLVALALFSALILFSVHAFFETPLFSVHILPILLLIIAASVF
ncbi:MAG: hypothetical protein A3E38_00655 [Candidatus Moranbacteria bacterium RIFCSPHIGHO2_12_FULL_54_9]|nr:MAG: hypothetical protein A3E38_00655 [Candidatus Moranbacteria bacterium RIFCSPHIGHO2_12_FULL_54_9]